MAYYGQISPLNSLDRSVTLRIFFATSTATGGSKKYAFHISKRTNRTIQPSNAGRTLYSWHELASDHMHILAVWDPKPPKKIMVTLKTSKRPNWCQEPCRTSPDIAAISHRPDPASLALKSTLCWRGARSCHVSMLIYIFLIGYHTLSLKCAHHSKFEVFRPRTQPEMPFWTSEKKDVSFCHFTEINVAN